MAYNITEQNKNQILIDVDTLKAQVEVLKDKAKTLGTYGSGSIGYTLRDDVYANLGTNELSMEGKTTQPSVQELIDGLEQLEEFIENFLDEIVNQANMVRLQQLEELNGKSGQ